MFSHSLGAKMPLAPPSHIHAPPMRSVYWSPTIGAGDSGASRGHRRPRPALDLGLRLCRATALLPPVGHVPCLRDPGVGLLQRASAHQVSKAFQHRIVLVEIWDEQVAVMCRLAPLASDANWAPTHGRQKAEGQRRAGCEPRTPTPHPPTHTTTTHPPPPPTCLHTQTHLLHGSGPAAAAGNR